MGKREYQQDAGGYDGGEYSDNNGPYPTHAALGAINPGPPPPLPTPPSVLLVKEVDKYGNPVVVLFDSKTVTSTILPGNPLPTADSTADPYGILKGARPTWSWASYPQKVHYNSTITQSRNGTTTSTSSSDSQTQNQAPPPRDKGPHVPIAIFVVVPLVILAMIVAGGILWRRKRKISKDGDAQSQQMKMRSPEDGMSQHSPPRLSHSSPYGPSQPPPGYLESTSGPLLMQTMSGASGGGPGAGLSPATTGGTTLSRSNTSRRASQNPIILGTNMQSAYLTGLDTSDAISTTSSTAQAGNANRRSYDGGSVSSDEPPPPYRPRSVPSISRGSSLRHPRGSLSITAALATLTEADLSQRLDGLGDSDDGERTPTAADGMRNPFEDPEGEDDDADSDGSTTPVQTPRRMRSPFDDGCAADDPRR